VNKCVITTSYCVCVGDADALLLRRMLYSFFFFSSRFLFHFPTEIRVRFFSVETSLIDLRFNTTCRMVSVRIQTFSEIWHVVKNIRIIRTFDPTTPSLREVEQVYISQTEVTLKHCSEARRSSNCLAVVNGQHAVSNADTTSSRKKL